MSLVCCVKQVHPVNVERQQTYTAEDLGGQVLIKLTYDDPDVVVLKIHTNTLNIVKHNSTYCVLSETKSSC